MGFAPPLTHARLVQKRSTAAAVADMLRTIGSQHAVRLENHIYRFLRRFEGFNR